MKSRQALAAGLCALAVVACSPTPSPPAPTSRSEPTPTIGPSTAIATTTEPPSASSARIVGPLSDGIPTTIDGAVVYVGAEADRHISRSTTTEPFLLGGWFHEARPTIFCPAYLYGTRWGCNAWIWLYPDALATGARTIYPTDPPNLTDADIYGTSRAVVLRVHTHDAACPIDFKGCELLPVEEAVVWPAPTPP